MSKCFFLYQDKKYTEKLNDMYKQNSIEVQNNVTGESKKKKLIY